MANYIAELRTNELITFFFINRVFPLLLSAGNAGEYYTPRAVTQFMVDIMNPQLGEKILDPACGTGGFLTCAIGHLDKQIKTAADKETLQKTIHGVEKKPLPHMLALTNMRLHGIDVPKNIKTIPAGQRWSYSTVFCLVRV